MPQNFCILNSNFLCSEQVFFVQDNKLVLFFTLKNNLNDKITINNFSATLSNGEEVIGECYPKVVKSNSITNCKAEFKSKPNKDYEEATIAIDYNLDPPNFFVFYIVTGVITAPVVQGAGIIWLPFITTRPLEK